MNEPGKDEVFAKQAKDAFDSSVERLDAATLSRLNQARHRALARRSGGLLQGQWLRWVPVTGVAVAAVVTVMIMNGPMPTATDDAFTASDFEMLLEEDSLEMFEDLEFYSWLMSTDLEVNGDVG